MGVNEATPMAKAALAWGDAEPPGRSWVEGKRVPGQSRD